MRFVDSDTYSCNEWRGEAYPLDVVSVQVFLTCLFTKLGQSRLSESIITQLNCLSQYVHACTAFTRAYTDCFILVDLCRRYTSDVGEATFTPALQSTTPVQARKRRKMRGGFDSHESLPPCTTTTTAAKEGMAYCAHL
jgi:hypothetical protein